MGEKPTWKAQVGVTALSVTGAVVAFALLNGPTVLREWGLLSSPPAAIAATQEPGASPQAAPGAPQSLAQSPEAAPDKPSLKAALEVDINESASSEGATESLSCEAAVATVSKASNKRCEQIALQNEGVDFRLTMGDGECSRCAYVGSSWRCVARNSGKCVVRR